MGPTWGPAAVGAVIGAAYAALNRFGMRRIWRAPHAPLNVVVTGGTRGLGKAMAREFLRSESTPAACMTAILCKLHYCLRLPLAIILHRSGFRSDMSWTLTMPCQLQHPCMHACRCGDKVYISSRSMAGVRKAMTQLREEASFQCHRAGVTICLKVKQHSLQHHACWSHCFMPSACCAWLALWLFSESCKA